MNNNPGSHNTFSLIAGLAALIPALLLVIPGLLQSAGYIGLNDMRDNLLAGLPALQLLLHPFVLLGGLLLSFVLNVFPAMKLRFERQPDGLVSVITLKPVLLHWLFVGTSLLMVLIILIYAFFENFNPAFH